MIKNYTRLIKTLLRFSLVMILLVSCSKGEKTGRVNESFLQPIPPAGEDFFLDVTHSSGIDFRHSIGDDHLTNIIESVGGGAAFFDYDQDGFLDLYMANGNYHNRLSDSEYKPEKVYTNQLFRNKGDGTFEDVTSIAKVGHTGYGMGVTIGDYNNDGYPDIYVSNHGPNVLYKNNGNGTFTDVSTKAGVAGDDTSVGAVWVDYDNDGLLDLFVGNYLSFDPDYKFYYAPDGFPGPLAFDGAADRLYRNLGNDRFEDVTEAMGVYDPNGRAMGVGAVDFDDDGFMDIYVANDHMVNYMYRNEGGKFFRDVGIQTGTAFNQSGEGTISMAVDFCDYNNNGLLDIWVSDDAFCSLYKNIGNAVFTEVSYRSGIAARAAQHVGWSSFFIDYNNDGYKDIFKVNGELKHLYGQEDQLFENNGDETFTEVSTERGAYFHEELVGRGACYGDFDNDGDMDIYIVNLNDYGVLLRNDHGNKNNWVMFQLVGTVSNRDAIGAKISITANGKQQMDFRKGATGYLSQSDHRVHFGLGDSKVIEKVEVRWPSGLKSFMENVEANQVVTIIESEDGK